MGREQRISAAEQRHVSEQVGVPVGKNVETMSMLELRRVSLRCDAGQWTSRAALRCALDTAGACYVVLAQARADLEAAAAELTVRGENALASILLRASKRTWDALPWDWPGKTVLDDKIVLPGGTEHECDPDDPCSDCRAELLARSQDRAVDEARDGK